MAGRVVEARIGSRADRKKLPPGRQAHWRELTSEPRSHLGYQRNEGAACGRWILRVNVGMSKAGAGRFRIVPIGLADDTGEAGGLSYADAEKAARKLIDAGGASPSPAKTGALTVRKAMELYDDFLRSQGKTPDGRAAVHILPFLGDTRVASLTREQLRKWLAKLAAAPAQLRPNKTLGMPNFRNIVTDEEGKRRRQASANRVLTVLKAALNHAADEGHVKDRDAWGRALKPFRGVERARLRWLTLEECRRLLNAADPDFRSLLRGALESGCRYSELARLTVHDFDADAGTLFIGKSKSGKARHVILTDAGATFFKSHAAGRAGDDLMFRKADGTAWKKSEQNRPMAAAVENARITPAIGLHGMRHTWASHAVTNGMPLMVVAKNLGHTDTRMVEKHYGHLAPSFERAMVRERAPDYGVATETNLHPLTKGKAA
jgi:integrase